MKPLFEVPYSLDPDDDHLTLCVNETPKGEFSTHMKNSACGGFHHGTYHKNKAEAAMMLLKRMTANYRQDDIDKILTQSPL